MERNGSPSLPTPPSLPDIGAPLQNSKSQTTFGVPNSDAVSELIDEEEKKQASSSGGLFGAALDKLIAFIKDSAMRVALVIIGIIVVAIALYAMVQRSGK